jgi:DNA topoisomerase I
MALAALSAAAVVRAGEARDHARSARLQYVSDAAPGILRRARGDGVVYIAPSGEPVGDGAELARIKSLAIPPAWTDVWICPSPKGHLQATGRDARGRKQYRYHPAWQAVRDANKFERLAAFAQALPRLRARVAEDQRLPGLPREKVLATIVRLLETTLIRVGNGEYARHNGSYGLTTLRNRHVNVDGPRLAFRFAGKGGKDHNIDVHSPRLARIVRRLRELPGQELFQYVDDEGVPRSIGSADVNEYLRETMGEEFSAKDFRTWQATVLTAVTLAPTGRALTEAEAKRNIAAAVASTAERLGNTPAICRKCYVHPAIIDAYLEGVTIPVRRKPDDRDDTALSADEKAVLRLLRSVVDGTAA